MINNNDIGFLGDYARGVVREGRSPTATTITTVAAQTYYSQNTANILSFQANLLTRANSIYQENWDSPAAYSQSFDTMVGELVKNITNKDDRKAFLAMAEETKRQHMIPIARSAERTTITAARDTIATLQSTAIGEVDVATALLTDRDPQVQQLGKSSLDSIMGRTMEVMALRDGTGSRLMAKDDIVSFVRRFNGKIFDSMVNSLLDRCDSGEDVRNLYSQLTEGKLSYPTYTLSDGGEAISFSSAVDRTFDPSDDTATTATMREKMASAVLAFEKRDIRKREMALLSDDSATTMAKGITQTTIDGWFSQHRDILTTGDAATQATIISKMATRVDRVPTQVVDMVKGAIRSGDEAAILSATPHVVGWYNNNPAALGRSFPDNDGMALAQMLSLMYGTSTASMAQPSLRERTLKYFSKNTVTPDENDHYTALAARYATWDTIAHTISIWKDNAMGKKYPGSGEVRDISPQTVIYYHNQFIDHLGATGGDVAAATTMMQIRMAQLGTSTMVSGASRPPALMELRPEDYPGVDENRETIIHAMADRGQRAFSDAISAGIIPEDAEYVGSFLETDETTVSDDGNLSMASKNGINHYNGTICPTYGHFIEYSFGGVPLILPVGRFRPQVNYYGEVTGG
jgi:hypothetical protein